MNRTTLLILLTALLAAGCASYPQSPAEQANYWASEAKAAAAKDDCISTAAHVERALSRPTGAARVKETIQSTPKVRDCYWGELDRQVSKASTGPQAATAHKQIEVAKSSEVFPANQIDGLHRKLADRAAEGNTTGSIPFDLEDKTDLFPALSSPDHQRKMADRSVQTLQKAGSVRSNLEPLLAYATKNGQGSAEMTRIESLLPTLRIRASELPAVEKVFPKFAAARKAEIVARVHLQLKGGDRLLQDDLQQALRASIKGVEWVPAPGPNVTTLVVERVRNDEKVIAERTQTITYARAEVNIAFALLLMPNNSSYLYEVITGGAEIEYGYVITASSAGQTIHDEVIRGKVGGEYRRCQNDRVQNVFGGVTSAGFVANDDMQRRCSGSSAVSIEGLRAEVLSKVAEGVLKVLPIKTAHELN